ncbi:MAG: septal ring lytic transglycosylase RlpA family protein [Actinomycetota bacterium]
MGRLRFPAAWVLLALAAAGCSTTCPTPPPPAPQTAMLPFPHAEGRRPGGPVPHPAYKVGDPYRIAGHWYYPRVDYDYGAEGRASWYGKGFHGRLTANGELFDQNDLTAAHQTLPLPSIIRVTNLENGRSVVLRVNDRGPFVTGRILDVSKKAAKLLGFHDEGTTRVRIDLLERESRQAAAELGGAGS